MAVAKKTVAKKTAAKKTVAKKKPTKAEMKAVRDAADLKNPLTGEDPNTYTQSIGATLSAPKKPNAYTPPTDPYLRFTQHRHRTRSQQFTANREGRILRDVPEYENVDMDAPGWDTSGMNEDFQTMMGFRGNKFTPNVTHGPAINEPHESNRHVPIQRRDKDLSGHEYRRASSVLAAYGVTPDNAEAAITDASDRANMRSILAGATHISGTGFYGGPSTPNTVMKRTEDAIIKHPRFSGNADDAWAITATGNSKSSPKAVFEQLYADGRPPNYPNAAAAHTAIMHVLNGGAPADVPSAPHGGIHGNTIAAAEAAKYLLDDPTRSVRALYDWDKNPKIGSYVGAHISASNPDSYRTSDVLSTQAAAPFQATQKAHIFHVVDPSGNPVMETHGTEQRQISHHYEAEDIGRNGLPKTRLANIRLRHFGLAGNRYAVTLDPNGRPKKGLSPGEEMLARGGPAAHALLDGAGRRAAFARGKTPSADHAQAQNQMQEHDWREQQISRPDMQNTMDTEYPGGEAKMRGTTKGSQEGFSAFDASTW